MPRPSQDFGEISKKKCLLARRQDLLAGKVKQVDRPKKEWIMPAHDLG
jgi:hypothetical protein